MAAELRTSSAGEYNSSINVSIAPTLTSAAGMPVVEEGRVIYRICYLDVEQIIVEKRVLGHRTSCYVGFHGHI